MGDAPQSGLGAAASQGFGRCGVQAVFEHVQIKRAQVFRAINLQLADDRVEFVDVKVSADICLQLRRAGQRKTVDLQQLVVGHSVCGRVKVAHVGH